MKTRKPSARIFRYAAKLTFLASVNPRDSDYSPYACDNLQIAFDLQDRVSDEDIEPDMFAAFFRPKHFYGAMSMAWWPPLKNNEWDYESRVLALLLCAEMCRDSS